MANEDLEQRKPKLNYRMERELLQQFRAWCVRENTSPTLALALLVESLLRGDIMLGARNVQPWERRDAG